MNSQKKAILASVAKLERENNWPTWKCARVLTDAMGSLGGSEASGKEGCDILEILYQELIELAKDGEYLIGQGNLGLNGDEPAAARNTECFLTEAGRQLMGIASISPK